MNNNLKTGDFIDFQNDSENGCMRKISIRNTEIELKYVIKDDIYLKCWVDRLGYIYIYILLT